MFCSSSLPAVSSTGGSSQEQQSAYLTEKIRVNKEVTARKPEAVVLKKLSLAGLSKLSRLRYS